MRLAKRLVADRRGASAAEFALVIPLMLAFIFGTIDIGRAFFEMNRAKKATQVGARAAVVMKPVSPGIATFSYNDQTVGGVAYTQGDRLADNAFGTLTCTSTACSCAQGGVCSGAANSFDASAFDNIHRQMAYLYPYIDKSQVRIIYSGAGLGYAGDPNGSDISPNITVAVRGLRFEPLSFFGLGSITLPDLQTSLTSEDLAGTVTN